MLSRWRTGRTLGTIKRCGIDGELFVGVHKDEHKRTMKFGLRWNPTCETWCSLHHMDSVVLFLITLFIMEKMC